MGIFDWYKGKEDEKSDFVILKKAVFAHMEEIRQGLIDGIYEIEGSRFRGQLDAYCKEFQISIQAGDHRTADEIEKSWSTGWNRQLAADIGKVLDDRQLLVKHFNSRFPKNRWNLENKSMTWMRNEIRSYDDEARQKREKLVEESNDAAKKKRDAAKKKRDAAKKGKKLLDVVITSGLPKHIEIDYLISELEPLEYAKLFDFLRSSGAPYQSVNEFDILNDIDYYVFTGIISKEDGLFLINHRNHIELMQDRFSKKLKLDKNNARVNSTFVRWLLIERGFNEFPESVKKVLKGADVDSVVIMDGIKGKDALVNSQEEKKKGRLSNLSNNKEYSDADVNDEGQKKSATRRKGRFADD